MSEHLARAHYSPHVGVILRLHRYGMRLAFAAAHVFAWLFIFQISYTVTLSVAGAIAQTAMLYAFSQIVLYVATPYVATELRHGVRQVMLAGVLMLVAAFMLLVAAFHVFLSGALVPWTLIGFAVLMGLYRAFYWIPYHAEMDSFHPHGRSQHFLYEISIAIAPFAAGSFLLVSPYSPMALLYGAAILTAFSAVPIFWMPERYESFGWSYREALESVYDSRHSALVWRMVADGFQGAVALIFWPLAIFLMTGWSYFVVGGIVSVTLLLAPIARGVYRRFLKGLRLERSVPVQVVVVVSAWILRTTVGSPIALIAVDTYARTGIQHAHIDAASFEQAADGGLFIDKFTVLKELALSMGRIAACVVGFVALMFMSVPEALVTLFVIAGFAAAASVILAADSARRPF